MRIRARRTRQLHVILLGGLVACTAPEVSLVSTPPNARVHLDGKPTRQATPCSFEIPYHGTLLLELELPTEKREWRPRRLDVSVPPPLPPVLFPFDLIVEAFQWLTGQRDRQVKVQFERRTTRPFDEERVRRLLETVERAALER